ncbi:zf-HC2 domain-containing protein [Bittarella massiliensis (ex Durand et al. 2017)]|uniref:zf-HC2 domain-containing protein n=1 Tax=Bittarella massiliensis (ex Durand et al. 2017) TaxID=1720313 RepID=UPI001AA12397|nr:zf-HC2 domain-containing protein [Bittarella massiliensis (ex Durand et al. 2017)]
MSGERTDIPCQVCLDLWPLVCDGVASEESRHLVEAHLAHCPSCRTETGEAPSLAPPAPPDDGRVLAALRRRLLAGGLLLAGLGCLVGLAITYSANMFYNLILLPLAGAAGALALGRRWPWAPLGCFGLTYLWLFLRAGWELLVHPGSMGWGEGLSFLLLSPLLMALIYSLLALAGAVIARLLAFVFRREPDGPARPHRPGGAT